MTATTHTPDLTDCRFHGNRELHRDAPAHHCCGHVWRCAGCGRSFDFTPSEMRAMEEKSTVVALTVHDLLICLAGHSAFVAALDGEEMLLRLATPDEVQRCQIAALDKTRHLVPGDDTNYPLMTRERAIELVTPANLFGNQR